VWQALTPHSADVYGNFISDEGAAGVYAAYGERLARLTAICFRDRRAWRTSAELA